MPHHAPIPQSDQPPIQPVLLNNTNSNHSSIPPEAGKTKTDKKRERERNDNDDDDDIFVLPAEVHRHTESN